MQTPPRAVVLLSGGLDSATALAVARDEGFETHALSFRYGQRHVVELAAAAQVATHLGATRHSVVDIDLGTFGGSALTDPGLDVPHGGDGAGDGQDIPITYVPARNTVFLSYGLALAETVGAWDVFIGASAVDYSGYPDCRPEFMAAFEAMANLATRATVQGERRLRIRTPLMDLSKAQTVRLGLDLGVDYGLTHSCYDPDGAGRACGTCDSCVLRARGFAELGVPDPALLAAH